MSPKRKIKKVTARKVSQKEKVAAILQDHEESIYRYAFHKLNSNSPNALEIVQKTAYRVLQYPDKLAEITETSQQWSYLRTVINRCIHDFISEQQVDSYSVLSLNVQGGDNFVVESWEQEIEEKVYLEQLLSHLEPLDQDILYLTALGLTQQEVAKALGLSRNTVGSHLKKSRETLKTIDESWRKEEC